jgi:methyl-accepting chemotaxis protein
MLNIPKFPLQLMRSRDVAHLLMHYELYKKEQQIAQDWIHKMLRGNYETQQVEINSTLLQSLAQLQAQLSNLGKTDAQHHWISKGLTQFMDLLRSVHQLDISDFSTRLISKIVRYLGAVQGTVFIVSRDESGETILEQTACYAGSTTQLRKQKIPIGNGLVGQTFLEKKTNILHKLPNNYLNIGSGLGEANPVSVVLLPLKINEQVEGVLEIASFANFEPYQIEFLEKLGENIASALLLKKTNEETKRFLSEMNEKNKLLQQKEEDTQRHLKEIQIAQKQIERVNNDLENTLQIINSSVIMVEFMPSGKLAKINENFTKSLGYEAEEIKRLSFQTLTNAESSDSCWQKLTEKQDWQGEIEMKKANGETIWLRTSFKPVLNHNQKVVRILQIAYDITPQKQQAIELEIQKQKVEQNEKLMLERTKSIQDKAYERIKKLREDFKEQLSAKEAELARLYERINELERIRA